MAAQGRVLDGGTELHFRRVLDKLVNGVNTRVTARRNNAGSVPRAAAAALGLALLLAAPGASATSDPVLLTDRSLPIESLTTRIFGAQVVTAQATSPKKVALETLEPLEPLKDPEPPPNQ